MRGDDRCSQHQAKHYDQMQRSVLMALHFSLIFSFADRPPLDQSIHQKRSNQDESRQKAAVRIDPHHDQNRQQPQLAFLKAVKPVEQGIHECKKQERYQIRPGIPVDRAGNCRQENNHSFHQHIALRHPPDDIEDRRDHN